LIRREVERFKEELREALISLVVKERVSRYRKKLRETYVNNKDEFRELIEEIRDAILKIAKKREPKAPLLLGAILSNYFIFLLALYRYVADHTDLDDEKVAMEMAHYTIADIYAVLEARKELKR